MALSSSRKDKKRKEANERKELIKKKRAEKVADMSKGYPSGYDYVAPTKPMEEDKEWAF